MGKTILVRKFERQTAVQFDALAGVQRRPVVVMLMPHLPTEARFFDQLLTALNAPSAGHFVRGFPVQEPAVRLWRELETRVVIIDELNSLLADTPRQQRVFLQLLRFLSNELRLAFVGVGVPEARHALLSDGQLRSRFTDSATGPNLPDGLRIAGSQAGIAAHATALARGLQTGFRALGNQRPLELGDGAQDLQ